MDFISLPFLIFGLVLVIAFNAVQDLNWRKLVLTSGNLVFLGFLIRDPLLFIPIAVFLLLTFGCLHLGPRLGKSSTLTASLAVLIAFFIWLKKYSFFEFLPQVGFPYTTIGLSYILFRCLHLVDYFFTTPEEKPPGPVAFFNYTCSFLTYISGPIGFFKPFENQYEILDQHRLNDSIVFDSFSRIATGALKISLLSAFFDTAIQILKTHSLALDFPLVGFLGGALGYMLFMYFNFSGYMDIVIGLGGLLGQKIPENFNYPFSANNMLEFWSRWHITLSEWFKTYLFNPIVKKLMYAFGNHKSLAPYLGAVAFFIVFFIMGMWHGTTPSYVIYGIFLGAGVSLNKFYQVYLTKNFKPAYKALKENLFYQVFSRALTTAYFAFSLTCVRFDYAGLEQLVVSIGIVKLILGFCLAVLTVASFWLVFETSKLKRFTWEAEHPLPRRLFLIAKIYLVIAAVEHAQVIPTFVYKVF